MWSELYKGKADNSYGILITDVFNSWMSLLIVNVLVSTWFGIS